MSLLDVVVNFFLLNSGLVEFATGPDVIGCVEIPFREAQTREALDLGVALLGRPEAPTQVRQHRAARVVRTHGFSSKAPTVLDLVRSRVLTAFELEREVAQLRQEAVGQLRAPRSRDTRPSALRAVYGATSPVYAA